jgi:hypothetical protein
VPTERATKGRTEGKESPKCFQSLNEYCLWIAVKHLQLDNAIAVSNVPVVSMLAQNIGIPEIWR